MSEWWFGGIWVGGGGDALGGGEFVMIYDGGCEPGGLWYLIWFLVACVKRWEWVGGTGWYFWEFLVAFIENGNGIGGYGVF